MDTGYNTEQRDKVLVDGIEVNAAHIFCKLSPIDSEHHEVHSIFICLVLADLLVFFNEYDEDDTSLHEVVTEENICGIVYDKLIKGGEEAVVGYLWLVPGTIPANWIVSNIDSISHDSSPKRKFRFFTRRRSRPTPVIEWIYVHTSKVYLDQAYLVIEGKCIKNQKSQVDTLLRPVNTANTHNPETLLQPGDISSESSPSSLLRTGLIDGKENLLRPSAFRAAGVLP